MKGYMKVVVAGFALALNVFTGTAQDSSEVIAPTAYRLGVGVHAFIAAGSINSVAGEGRKVNPDIHFLPAFGATIYAPFSMKNNLGARLDIGINEVGTRMRPFEYYDGESNFNGYFIERYRYFTIAPQLNFAGVTLGAGINIPMSGRMWNPKHNSEDFYVDRETLKTAVDIRIGGMIKAWESPIGKLYVDVLASYWVSGLYEKDMYTNGSPVGQYGEPNVVSRTIEDNVPGSFRVGISYLFDINFK